ncbi:hypothetical protein AAVH_02065 [Aphelenchoides avenae]|nr:hypothetical protein AAVH_02065 [Aphelenchus avenae]
MTGKMCYAQRWTSRAESPASMPSPIPPMRRLGRYNPLPFYRRPVSPTESADASLISGSWPVPSSPSTTDCFFYEMQHSTKSNNDQDRRLHRPRCSSRTGSVADERSPSQFNPATFDAVSIHSRRRSYSNLDDARDPAGQMVVYEPHLNSLPMMPPAVPFWLPAMSPPPPPPMWYPTIAPPPDAKACRKMFKEMMKYEQKQFEANKPRSACAEFCCGSVASLLWIIIGIIVGAIILALILAFFVV